MNDERMLEILADIDEARRDVEHLRNDFPRALKRWAGVEKQMGDHYYHLSGVIIDQNAGEISEEKIAHILSATSKVPDADGAWDELKRLAALWDVAIRKLIRACSMYVAYKSYEEAMEHRSTSVVGVLNPYSISDEIKQRGKQTTRENLSR